MRQAKLTSFITISVILGFLVLGFFTNPDILLIPQKYHSYMDEVLFFLLAGIVMTYRYIMGGIFIPYSFVWFMLMLLYLALSAIMNDIELGIAVASFFLILKPYLLLMMGEITGSLSRETSKHMHLIDTLLRKVIVVFVLSVVALDIIAPNNPISGMNLYARFGYTPARGLFYHPTFIAVFCVLPLCYLVSRIILFGEKRDWIYLAMTVFLILAVARLRIMLFSFVAILFIITVIHYYRHDIYRLMKHFIYVSLMGIPLVLITLNVVFQDVDLYLKGDAMRTKLLVKSVEINQDTYGLGLGPGRFGSPSSTWAYNPYYQKYDILNSRGMTSYYANHITDQWWAWYLGELGLVGCFFFVLFIASFMLKLGRIIPTAMEYAASFVPWLVTSMALLFYGLLVGYSEAFFHGTPMGYISLYLAGFCLSQGRALRERTRML